MKDVEQVLRERYRQPRIEFSNSLMSTLRTREANEEGRLRNRIAFVGRLVALVSLTVLLAAVTSPEVMAQVKQFVNGILEISNGDVRLRVIDYPLPEPESSSIPIEIVSFADAREILSFKIPQWIPEGYDRQEMIHVLRSDQDIMIGIKWVPTDNSIGQNSYFLLNVSNHVAPTVVVGTNGGATVITINDHPGMLFQGAWDPSSRTFGGTTLHLVWAQDGLSYQVGGDGMTEQTLIRIAESIE